MHANKRHNATSNGSFVETCDVVMLFPLCEKLSENCGSRRKRFHSSSKCTSIVDESPPGTTNE